MASQLQGFLDEKYYLDPFQYGFRPGFGTETAMVSDRSSLPRIFFLDSYLSGNQVAAAARNAFTQLKMVHQLKP